MRLSDEGAVRPVIDSNGVPFYPNEVGRLPLNWLDDLSAVSANRRLAGPGL